MNEHSSTLTSFNETREYAKQPTETIALTVAPASSGSGNKYYLTVDGEIAEAASGLAVFVRDNLYIFDQSDSSNITHGLHIGTVENDASTDINNVSYYPVSYTHLTLPTKA